MVGSCWWREVTGALHSSTGWHTLHRENPPWSKLQNLFVRTAKRIFTNCKTCLSKLQSVNRKSTVSTALGGFQRASDGSQYVWCINEFFYRIQQNRKRSITRSINVSFLKFWSLVKIFWQSWPNPGTEIFATGGVCNIQGVSINQWFHEQLWKTPLFHMKLAETFVLYSEPLWLLFETFVILWNRPSLWIGAPSF